MRQCKYLLFAFLVFNLTNKVDVEETERKIAEYKEGNKDLISQNRGKLVRRLGMDGWLGSIADDPV